MIINFRSSPSLSIYREKDVHEKLKEMTAIYLRDNVEYKNGILFLPSIFQWYGGDFINKFESSTSYQKHSGYQNQTYFFIAK